MSSMPVHIQAAYTDEMTAARTAADDTTRWAHLERAHILSQPYPWPHTRNHLAMLVLALRRRDRRETLGQVVRIIVAAPRLRVGPLPRGQHRPLRCRADDPDADAGRSGPHPRRNALNRMGSGARACGRRWCR